MKWRVLGECTGVYTRDRTHQMEKTEDGNTNILQLDKKCTAEIFRRTYNLWFYLCDNLEILVLFVGLISILGNGFVLNTYGPFLTFFFENCG